MIKKLSLFLIVFSVLFSFRAYAPPGNVRVNRARYIKVQDSGGYYTGTQVEAVLQEIGAGTALDDLYINDDGDTYTGTHDAGGASFEIPNSTSLPGTCTVGELYMDTNATSGQRFYLCESSDTWKLQGDGAGGGSGSMTTVKEEDTPVGDADIVTLDFGAGFDLAETPDTEIQVTLDFSEAAPTLDQVGNLGASKTFTMAANNLTFNFTTPSEGFTLNSTGAFSDHLLHLHQSSGNPGVGTQLAHFQCVDLDVTNLVLEYSGDNASKRLLKLQLDRASTSDNDEVYTSYYFDQDGTVSSQGELEFIRVSGVATDVSEDTEDAKITWDLISGGSLLERMVLDNAGALQIDGGITAGDTSTFEDVRIFDSGNDPTLNIGDSTSGGDFGFLRWVSATDTLNLGTTVGGTFNDQITLLESGKVGIGTIIPPEQLSVGNDDTSAGVIAILEDTDDGANYASFTVPALGANTVYTLPPDDGDNTEVLQTDGNGVLTWVANAGGGATAWDDIADPDAAGSISFDDTETVTFSFAQNTAGSAVTILNTQADVTNDVYMLSLEQTDNGDPNALFIRCLDDAGAGRDVVFSVGYDGDVHTEADFDGRVFYALTGFDLGTADYVGIGASSERFVFYDSGSINVRGANFRIGLSGIDADAWDFQIISDADADGGVNTPETFQIKLTANADPTAAVWAFTNTQSAGYSFDDNVTSTGTVEGATITEGGSAVYSEGEIPNWGRYATWTFDDDTENVNPFLQFKRGKDGPANVVDGSWLGDIRFKGWGSGDYQLGAFIGAAVDGTPGDSGTDMPTKIFFMTSPDGSATPVLALVIGPDGNINAQDGNITTTGTFEAATITEGGVAVRTKSDEFSKSFVILDPIATDDYPIWRSDEAITITGVHIQCLGNAVVGHLVEMDANGLNAAGVDGANDITGVVNENVNDDGDLSNPSIDAGDYVGWRTTSITSTPTSVTVTFDYTIN